MSKIIGYIRFYMISSGSSRHFFIQSDVKRQPIVNRSRTVPSPGKHETSAKRGRSCASYCSRSTSWLVERTACLWWLVKQVSRAFWSSYSARQTKNYYRRYLLISYTVQSSDWTKDLRCSWSSTWKLVCKTRKVRHSNFVRISQLSGKIRGRLILK